MGYFGRPTVGTSSGGTSGGGTTSSGGTSSGGTSPGGYTPETFDRSWLMPGTNFYATPEVQQSWQNELSNRGGQTTIRGWRGGQYGWSGRAGEAWRPFGQQPTSNPLFISDPSAYREGQEEEQRGNLMDEFQTAQDEARAATEERYQEALANLEGVGTQESADINTRFDSSGSAVNQSLVSSGLAGTTVMPSMQRGVERERSAAQSRLATDLARERNQIIQSRNDIGPDISTLINLLFQQGAGGGGAA
jgi:hypothetical protein